MHFTETFPFKDVVFDESELPVMSYIARFAAKRVVDKLGCKGCHTFLVDEEHWQLNLEIECNI